MVITVADTGAGMNAETKQKLFEAFSALQSRALSAEQRTRPARQKMTRNHLRTRTAITV